MNSSNRSSKQTNYLNFDSMSFFIGCLWQTWSSIGALFPGKRKACFECVRTMVEEKMLISSPIFGYRWNWLTEILWQDFWICIVNRTLGNKLQWNINRNLNIFIQENAFENVVWKMAVFFLGFSVLRHLLTKLSCHSKQAEGCLGLLCFIKQYFQFVSHIILWKKYSSGMLRVAGGKRFLTNTVPDFSKCSDIWQAPRQQRTIAPFQYLIRRLIVRMKGTRDLSNSQTRDLSV